MKYGAEIPKTPKNPIISTTISSFSYRRMMRSAEPGKLFELPFYGGLVHDLECIDVVPCDPPVLVGTLITAQGPENAVARDVVIEVDPSYREGFWARLVGGLVRVNVWEDPLISEPSGDRLRLPGN